MTNRFPKQNLLNSSDGIKRIADAFHAHLKARGHSEGTQCSYNSALRHFLNWYASKAIKNEIDTNLVHDFLHDHLPVCQCKPPIFKELKTVRAALNQLLLMFGQDRLLPNIYENSATIDKTLRELDEFQRNVCGLTESTRLNNARSIRRFLLALFGKGPIDSKLITPEVLTDFVASQAKCLKPSSTGQILSRLRNYMRFLQFKGESNSAVVGTVPRPPNWSLAHLPSSLDERAMEKFWAAFDTSTPIGKRDYAIARCLADLGLRGNEVTSLTIDDIDWRKGLIKLHHNKNRREDQLPLPAKTGRAIVNYLRNGRPATVSRSVFVLHRAPIGREVKITTVTNVIRRAFLRAGLPYKGTHVLRHTAATFMIQNGVPLKEVADILRHQSIDTTQIYTKVNLPGLKCVAMPWPGRSV